MLIAFIVDIILVLLILYLEENKINEEWYIMMLANIMFCVGVAATLLIMD
jgi:ABC-type Mn2+/Zn2+ transport system permease subunit